MLRENRPLVSIVLATKNGLPYVKNTISSLLEQTYKNFELIVQDGVSTDGTAEYLQAICDKNQFQCCFDSSPDNGIRQAYGRGLKKCRGEIIYFTASDESLFPSSLKTAVSYFQKSSDLSVVYGSLSCIDEKGNETEYYTPNNFDYSRFLKFECSFPAAAAFFKHKALKEIINDLSFDEPTSALDFDLWLRLGQKLTKDQIFLSSSCFAKVLATRTSSSFRADTWKQFSQDGSFMLSRFFNGSTSKSLLLQKPLQNYQSRQMGFAARQTLKFEGFSMQARELVAKQEGLSFAAYSPPYNSEINHQFSFQNIKLAEGSKLLNVTLHWKLITKIFYSFEHFLYKILSANLYFSFYKSWRNAKGIFYNGLAKIDSYSSSSPKIKSKVVARGGPNIWGYITCLDLHKDNYQSDYKYWIKIEMKIITGAVGICLMNGEEIEEEKTFIFSPNLITTYFPLPEKPKNTLIFRNNLESYSIVELNQVSIISAKYP